MRKPYLGLAFSFCVASMLFIAAGRVCRADPVQYVINPNPALTYLELSGWYVNPDFVFAGQGDDPDTLRTSYTGIISADLTGGVLTFSGGSTITAVENFAGPFAPDPVALPGVDNYGISVPSPVGVLADAAIRSLALDFTAGTLSDGAVPTMDISIPSYIFAFEVYDTFFTDPDFGEEATSDGAQPNTTANLASVMNNGVEETLIIPIVRVTDDPELEIRLEGQIVATRVVPEPATCVLMGLGLIGLVAFSRRRRRR